MERTLVAADAGEPLDILGGERPLDLEGLPDLDVVESELCRFRC